MDFKYYKPTNAERVLLWFENKERITYAEITDLMRTENIPHLNRDDIQELLRVHNVAGFLYIEMVRNHIIYYQRHTKGLAEIDVIKDKERIAKEDYNKKDQNWYDRIIKNTTAILGSVFAAIGIIVSIWNYNSHQSNKETTKDLQESLKRINVEVETLNQRQDSLVNAFHNLQQPDSTQKADMQSDSMLLKK